MGACHSQPDVFGEPGVPSTPTKLQAAVPTQHGYTSLWRRQLESTRQTIGASGASLPRTTVIAKQVANRAEDLHRIKAGFGTSHQQVTSFLTAVGRAIEAHESEKEGAFKLHPDVKANLANAHIALADVSSNLNARLTQDVYTPILAWQARERQIFTQYKAADAARLELESRRRSVAELERRAANGKIASGSKQEAKLQEQTAKRNAMEAAYTAQEEDVACQLETLLVDPTLVQRLAAMGMDALTDAFSRVAATLHMGLPPAPEVALPSSGTPASSLVNLQGAATPRSAPGTPRSAYASDMYESSKPYGKGPGFAGNGMGVEVPSQYSSMPQDGRHDKMMTPSTPVPYERHYQEPVGAQRSLAPINSS